MGAEREIVMLKLLKGPQTLGRGKVFWSCFLVSARGRTDISAVRRSYDVGNFAYFLIWIFMALGLCLMWGYGGMLSFGQTLFFGIAGYGYGVLAINMGGGTATIVALCSPLSLRWWRPASWAIS